MTRMKGVRERRSGKEEEEDREDRETREMVHGHGSGSVTGGCCWSVMVMVGKAGLCTQRGTNKAASRTAQAAAVVVGPLVEAWEDDTGGIMWRLWVMGSGGWVDGGR
jgi:hypothetical protein